MSLPGPTTNGHYTNNENDHSPTSGDSGDYLVPLKTPLVTALVESDHGPQRRAQPGRKMMVLPFKEMQEDQKEDKKLKEKLQSVIRERTAYLASLATFEKENRELQRANDVLDAKVKVYESDPGKQGPVRTIARLKGHIVQQEHEIKDLRLEIRYIRRELEDTMLAREDERAALVEANRIIAQLAMHNLSQDMGRLDQEVQKLQAGSGLCLAEDIVNQLMLIHKQLSTSNAAIEEYMKKMETYANQWKYSVVTPTRNLKMEDLSSMSSYFGLLSSFVGNQWQKRRQRHFRAAHVKEGKIWSEDSSVLAVSKSDSITRPLLDDEEETHLISKDTSEEINAEVWTPFPPNRANEKLSKTFNLPKDVWEESSEQSSLKVSSVDGKRNPELEEDDNKLAQTWTALNSDPEDDLRIFGQMNRLSESKAWKSNFSPKPCFRELRDTKRELIFAIRDKESLKAELDHLLEKKFALLEKYCEVSEALLYAKEECKILQHDKNQLIWSLNCATRTMNEMEVALLVLKDQVGVLEYEKDVAQTVELEKMKEECHRWKEECEDLRAKMAPFQEQLLAYAADREVLMSKTSQTMEEFKALSLKYAKSLGHQNYKQKVHYMINLKEENLKLKEENEKLRKDMLKLKIAKK